MTRVVIRHSARNDLRSIHGFIRKRNPERAVTFVQELKQMCLSLEQFPRRYPLEPAAGIDIHKMAYKGYTTFYRYDEPSDTVYVLSIMEDHQDY